MIFNTPVTGVRVVKRLLVLTAIIAFSAGAITGVTVEYLLPSPGQAPGVYAANQEWSSETWSESGWFWYVCVPGKGRTLLYTEGAITPPLADLSAPYWRASAASELGASPYPVFSPAPCPVKSS